MAAKILNLRHINTRNTVQNSGNMASSETIKEAGNE